ncbi:hypothetical protein OSTOST_12060, partial [Ostertagia ostertagi]
MIAGKGFDLQTLVTQFCELAQEAGISFRHYMPVFKPGVKQVSNQTIENGVAILALNRPEKYNSFNREMALELQKQLDACAEDEAVRCIVITGTGKGTQLCYTMTTHAQHVKKIVPEAVSPATEFNVQAEGFADLQTLRYQ